MKENLFVIIITVLSLGLRFKSSFLGDIFWTIGETGLFLSLYLLFKKKNLLWAKIAFVFMAFSPWLIGYSPVLKNFNFSAISLLRPINILENLFYFFSPGFLFYRGVWPGKPVFLEYQGMMYWTDFIFLIFGFKEIFLNENKKTKILIFSFLIIFAFLLATTGGYVNFSFLLSLPLLIISARGAVFLVKKKKIFFALFVINLYFIVRFLDLYFFHY